MTTLTRGATVYELTDEERATMKRLIDAGLVVGIGKHARLRAKLEQLADAHVAASAEIVGLRAVNAELVKALSRIELRATIDDDDDARRECAHIAAIAKAALAKAKETP